MATPCQSNDGLTQAEAQCVLDRHPGMIASFGGWGWSTDPSQYTAMVCEWFYGIRPDEVKNYPSLDAYLRASGCRGGGTGGTPPPGGGSTPGPIAGMNTQTLMYIGIGFAIGLLLGRS